MGVFYSMSGSVIVKDVPEVQAIVDRFNAESTSDLYVENSGLTPDDHLLLEFGGGVYCSYSTVSDLDDIARELSAYAVEPTYINYECDGENGQLYIGPEDQEENFNSSAALEEIKGLVSSLTIEDLHSLIDHCETEMLAKSENE